MSSKFRLGPLLQASSLFFHQPHRVSLFLVPLLHTPYRAASILSALSDNPGAYNKKIRRGRGPSSGKGKTSGRGYNGQKAHGKVPRGFNGGQTPDHIVNPIRGTDNRNIKFVSTATRKTKMCHRRQVHFLTDQFLAQLGPPKLGPPPRVDRSRSH